MKNRPVFVLFLLLAGCGTSLTGYDYRITAVYQAPQSKFRMTIQSEGHVKAGSDTSDSYKGTVRIEPISPQGKNIVLSFQDNDEVMYKIDAGAIRKGPWGFRDSQNTLGDILRGSGYEDIDEEELKEVIGAMGGAFGGPKGVRLKGQSEHIEVISVDLGEKTEDT